MLGPYLLGLTVTVFFIGVLFGAKKTPVKKGTILVPQADSFSLIIMFMKQYPWVTYYGQSNSAPRGTVSVPFFLSVYQNQWEKCPGCKLEVV